MNKEALGRILVKVSEAFSIEVGREMADIETPTATRYENADAILLLGVSVVQGINDFWLGEIGHQEIKDEEEIEELADSLLSLLSVIANIKPDNQKEDAASKDSQ